ncbi:ribonuclease HII [Candidatus Woesearchaeota archaeon]|nr:ribonuclease HII [Candidatus Woesearchaeota archaeon]
MTLICGIDEARRGPVVGPLVICGALIDEIRIEELRKIEVKDSKLLTSKQRESLAKKIEKVLMKYKIIIIEPKEIDKAVQGNDGLNLNWLEARKSAEIINELKPDKAIVDSPSPNIPAYARYLKKYIKNKKMELIAEHRAERYPIVAAASIIAKVTGDNEIKKLQSKIKEPIGSGYPSDPATQKFVKDNYSKYPEIFRKSWQPYKKIIKESQQKKLGSF